MQRWMCTYAPKLAALASLLQGIVEVRHRPRDHAIICVTCQEVLLISIYKSFVVHLMLALMLHVLAHISNDQACSCVRHSFFL